MGMRWTEVLGADLGVLDVFVFGRAAPKALELEGRPKRLGPWSLAAKKPQPSDFVSLALFFAGPAS
jgi:hypothetical protein